MDQECGDEEDGGPMQSNMPSGSGDPQKQTNEQERPTKVITTIRIAPPSESDKIDERAARCRTRRERPQKLRIPNSNEPVDAKTGGSSGAYEYEPDLESFVSGCTGMSFTGVNDERSAAALPQRRRKLVRKRSLPTLTFLSTTHLAAAEKKRKREELERQNALAEEEAKKALLLNPIEPATADSGVGGESLQSQEVVDQVKGGGDSAPQKPETAAPVVTRTTENASNILMPPLLKNFLRQLESKHS